MTRGSCCNVRRSPLPWFHSMAPYLFSFFFLFFSFNWWFCVERQQCFVSCIFKEVWLRWHPNGSRARYNPTQHARYYYTTLRLHHRVACATLVNPRSLSLINITFFLLTPLQGVACIFCIFSPGPATVLQMRQGFYSACTVCVTNWPGCGSKHLVWWMQRAAVNPASTLRWQ